MTTYGLGIDAGGTYTDSVIVDLSDGRPVCGSKALTTRNDLSTGIRESLLNLDGRLLEQVSLASLSSTLATNAVVEGKGCRVGLVCIGKRYGRADEPERYAVVDGRFGMSGAEEIPLDEDAARAALEGMAGAVDSLAVSGYVSVRNPSHEDRIAAMAASVLGIPVVRGHELTSSLGFEQRTTTAVMNARLIPVIRELLESVEETLGDMGVRAPLMMVKGDGALMSAATAALKPVETILSGPASSLTGAKALTNVRDGVVADVGGTTTDVGVLKNGFPEVEPEGALIGGKRTRVMAADISTFGIGGDSRILLNGRSIGIAPVKAVPLCIAAERWPSVKEALRALDGRSGDGIPDDRRAGDIVQDFEFLTISRRCGRDALDESDRSLLDLLEEGPRGIAGAAAELGVPCRSIRVSRLEDAGLIERIGFTPTDVLHAEGGYTEHDAEASRLAAGYIARTCRMPVDGLIAAVKEMVSGRMAASIMEKIILDESEGDELTPYQSDLVRDIVGGGHRGYKLGFGLMMPIVGMGAPAGAWLPRAAEILGAELILPEGSAIGNAIGAITGSVTETRAATVRPVDGEPSESPACRVFVGGGITILDGPEEAVAFAIEEASHLAKEAAKSNGCAAPVVDAAADETWVDAAPGRRAFAGAEITARASGKPDLCAVSRNR